MELRHLRYFKAVAERLNFSRAAEGLCVAQPALSRQIRALEEELGAQLLDRNRVSVQLTDAGRCFYAQTCKILAQVDMAVSAVQEVKKGTGGELIICHDWQIDRELVPDTLAEFREKYPRVDVVLQDRSIHDQLTLIARRRAHLGFVVRELLSRRSDLRSLLLYNSRVLVALPREHRLARKSEVCLADLANERWISIDPKVAPDYANYLIRLCRMSGFTPSFGQFATTIEGMVGRVSSGYGVALVTEHITPPHQHHVVLVPLDCEPIELCAVWHRHDDSPLLHEYLEILRAHLARSKGPAAIRV